MKKLTEQEGTSLDIVNENFEALKIIFPEAFTEDGVNFDTLRQLLGDEVDEGEEKYGLNWHGKKRARQIALTPSTGTLRPCPEESVDWKTTQNLFIEGDNLEVLKLLQKSYAGKVKMIYIDPPYNTGKEFIYPDRFQDNLDTYLKYTGQKTDEGFKLSSNTERSGRYHTNWLNMMYPRLKLARNLLSDEGVIFISIDDNEGDNLKKICDQIFGEENLLTTFHIKVRYEGKTLVEDMNFQKLLEMVLVYRKSNELSLVKKKEEYSLEKFCWQIIETGNPSIITLGGKQVSILQPEQYEIKKCVPSNDGLKEIWATGKILDGNSSGRFFRDYLTGRVEEDGLGVLYKVSGIGDDAHDFRYFTGPKRETATKGKYYQGVPNSVLSGEKDSKELPIITFLDMADSFGNCRHEGGVDFRDGKKPIKLLKRLMEIVELKNEDVVFDFFAGSCSTAHAVIVQNCAQGKAVRFIMTQLPEPVDEKSDSYLAGFKTISDIGKERIRRAAAKIKEENPGYDGDLGLKVFKLDSSNIRAWNPDKDDLAQTLLDHTEHLVEGRSEEDVLYELLLKRGVDLTVPIEKKEIADKTVYSIGYGVLFACLDTSINQDEVENVAQGIIAWHQKLEPASDTQVVFRDSAFADDIAKTNMTAILEQNGIGNVRAL